MTEANQPRLHAVEDSARFTVGNETTDSSTTPPTGSAPPPSGRTQSKARPERPIPTDRLRFDNQLEVLKAVASLSGNSRRGVSAETMSAAIGLKGGTGGLNSRFFRFVNWFESVGRGEYTASPGVLAYAQHINVDPEGHVAAAAGMRAEMRRSWVWEVVGPLLESGQPIREKALLLPLAQAAGAQNHTAQLETIVEWLVWVGLVVRDGESIRLTEAEQPGASAPVDETSADGGEVATPEADAAADQDAAQSMSVQPASPTRAAVDNEAIISFNISVRLTADDVQHLSDEQMQFVMGLAEKLRG